MRSLYPFPDRFYRISASLNRHFWCLFVVAVVSCGSALAQVGCTYRAGTIRFVATGGSTNPAYTTQYLLADPQGTILATSTTTAFSAVAAGSYQVVALNYDPAKPIAGNTTGSSLSQITGACFDLSAPFTINVCPQDGTTCDYSVGTISFSASGGNTTAGYLTRYLLTDSTGIIRAVSTSAVSTSAVSTTVSFSVPNPGAYLAYGLNYKDDGSLAGLTVGQSLSGVSAACFDLGTPLIVAVCAQQLVSLLPKVYLQGALFGVRSPAVLMRDDLRTKNLIPLNSPYPGLGFTELSVTGATTSGVLSSTGSDAIVDWVFVELRSPSSASVVVDSRSALVQRDGDIVGTDGVSAVLFSQATAGSYFVSVRHRNHLGVMSQGALPLSNTAVVVDFRNPATPTYNFDVSDAINQAQVVVDQGVALWAGNTLVDDGVIYQGTGNDVEPIHLQVLNAGGNFFVNPTYVLSGYVSGDVNLNGETIFQGTGNDLDFIYQNVIKNHPGNTFKANNFIIRQQLPQ